MSDTGDDHARLREHIRQTGAAMKNGGRSAEWLSVGARPRWTVCAVRCYDPPRVSVPELPFHHYVVGVAAALATFGPVHTEHPRWPGFRDAQCAVVHVAVFCTMEDLTRALGGTAYAVSAREIDLRRPDAPTLRFVCVSSFDELFRAVPRPFRFALVDDEAAVFPLGEDRAARKWIFNKL